MEIIILPVYFAVLITFAVFSYGFVDLNLQLSSNPVITAFLTPLRDIVFNRRPLAAVLFFILLSFMTGIYIYAIKHPAPKKYGWIIAVVVILVFSYPALTYDLFNYITTAKVAFHYQENPYVVMPVEISNEPYLAFTRAANKYALYGPVWIALTYIPHMLGMGSVWQTIIAFKFMNALVYVSFLLVIRAITNSPVQVLFFALNPLVIIEILISGHNDLYMMLPAVSALYLWHTKEKKYAPVALLLLISSWFVKGATLILTGLFIRRTDFILTIKKAYWLLLGVFLILAPLREELYPWYAVWMISVAALLPYKQHRFIWGFTIVLSVALELRHLPYMWMGYYEGPGPILRSIATVAPVSVYVLYWGVKEYMYAKK